MWQEKKALMGREGEKNSRRWNEEGGSSISKAVDRALTFINIDRNLLAEKCCAITTKAIWAEKNRQEQKKKEEIKGVDTQSDFAPDRSCFQWASSKSSNHQRTWEHKNNRSTQLC